MFTFKQNLISSAVSTALLWLLSIGGVNAQIVYDRVFGTATGTEQLYSMTVLRAGGYMMAGLRYMPLADGQIYLLRLNNQGDTLWTKGQQLPNCLGYYPHHIIEDAAGRLLVTGQSYTLSGTTQADAFLALFNAQGDTLWTRRVASIDRDDYGPPQLLPNGDYLVGGNLNGAPCLQRITPTGQLVWQQYPVYSPSDNGYIGQLFPGGTPGTYWATLHGNNLSDVSRFVQYDANGTQGSSVPFPAALWVFDQIVSVGNEYVVTAMPPINAPNQNATVMRLDAAFNVRWSRQLTSRGVSFRPSRLLALPNGNIVAGSESFSSLLALHTLDPRGQVLHDTTFQAPGNLFMKGLAVDPPTGDYVFAGYSTVGPIGGDDIFWTQLHHRVITATRASQVAGQRWQAYPNPLAADGHLHLQAEQPLRGTLRLRDALGRQLAIWPAAGQLTQTLPLPSALPAGTYLLTLDSPGLPPRTLRLVQP
jgi:hypothetical protein